MHPRSSRNPLVAITTLAGLGMPGLLGLFVSGGCAHSARPRASQPWTATQVPHTNYRTPAAEGSAADTPTPWTGDDIAAMGEMNAQYLASLREDAGAGTPGARGMSGTPGGEPQFTGTEIGRVIDDAPGGGSAGAGAMPPRDAAPRGAAPRRPGDATRSSFNAVVFNPRPGEPAQPVASTSLEPIGARNIFERPPAQPALGSDTPRLEGADLSALDLEDKRMLLIEMRRLLFRDSVESNQPLRELLAMAMMAYIDPELELEPEAFRDLTDDERELLEQMQACFRALGERLDGSLPARDVIVDELLKLKGRLVEEPQLDLPTIALCWKVDGFAMYTQLDKYAFLAFEEEPVILYLEIGGFQSEQNQQGEWVTEISQLVEIYSDRDGVPVWADDWVKFPDVSKQRRTDFYVARIIAIPDRLAPGAYHLKVRMRDEKSRAEAEASVQFRVVAQRELAVGG